MRNKVSKITMTILLMFCMAISMFVVNVKAADSDSAGKVDDCERVVKAYTAEKATKYLSGSNSYPTLEGYLFSGWYTDEVCDINCALAGKTPSGTVYALFVPEHVLSVKAQVSLNLIDDSVENDVSASLRFVTTVDTLLYKQVGFEVSYVDGNGATHKATSVSNKVYKQLYVSGSNEEVWKVTPEGTFCGLSSYFRACTITGIPTQNHVTEFTARPFWVTLDGDKVYGVEATKRIVDGCLREEVWVSSEDASSGQDKYNYGSYDYPYKTLDYAIDHVIDGGVIHVKDSLTVAGNETWTAHDKNVTIAGDDSDTATETLTFDSNVIDIYDSVKFTGLSISFADNTTVYAWGNKLEIASDVKGINNASANAVSVYGGGRTAITDDTELILCAGTYKNVYGGGRNVAVTGDTNVVIGGDANVTSVYGGGSSAEVIGDTYVTMNGGYAQEIYGGCESANLQGNTNVRVDGGQVKRRVYGGCYNASTQSADGYLWNTTLSLTWVEPGYQVTGNTNVSIAGNANLLFDYSETLEGTYMEKTIKMDNSLIPTSRYKSAFQNEYGTLIFNDNLYSTLGSKAGFTCNYEVTSGSPNSTYHYLVQASVSENEDGEVYSEGDCLRIVPGQDKAATVRVGSKTGEIVFYTTEESYYPLPEPSSATTNIYVTFGTNVQTDEQKTFINGTAEARVGSAYYKTIEEAIVAAEQVKDAKVTSLKGTIKVVNLDIIKHGRGTVTTSKNNYLVGEKVTVKVMPDAGYSCAELSVGQNGKAVALDRAVTSAGETYSFLATEESYTVEATFVQFVLDEEANSWQPDCSIDDLLGNEYYTAKDYMDNPSLFVPIWSDKWNPPAELLDFEKKWRAFFTPNGRLMSMAHRGDNDIYYPENSIEGILSCIAAGVDMIEIDIATTKDGVHVLMHDNTVTRTTNVSQLRASGVTGLPTSNNVSDWTFEQLRRLRLVYESANGSVVTNYVIPTYEDVVMVCANKIFVYMDIKDRTAFDWEQDAYPIIKKYNAYRSVWLPLDYSNWLPADSVEKLLSTIEKDSGYKAAFQCSVTPTDVANRVQMINTYNWPLALRAGAYDETTYDSAFEPYLGQYRIHVNTIFTDYDNLDGWKKIYEKGYNSIQVDDYMTLVQYITDIIKRNDWLPDDDISNLNI